MFWDLIIWPSLALILSLGVAWPLVRRLAITPAEQVVALVALSTLAVFLFAWSIYVTSLPRGLLWLPLLLGAGAFFVFHGDGWATCRDPVARSLLVNQALVTTWCLGWLALVQSYSGGGWAGDWVEHWERTLFFLNRWPHDFLFVGRYPLTARPPLENVLTAFFLQVTRADFAHYQIFSTLLSSLVFLPAALLAQRFGAGTRTTALLAVLFMLNPLFVENATFAWTKLLTAFFVLTALYFFLRARDGDAPEVTGLLAAGALAAGLLTHYSAGPYAVVLAFAWIALGSRRRGERAWWMLTARSALVAGGVLTAWFGWAFATYGVRGTLFSNTSVTALSAERDNPLIKILLNLRDTLVPHFLRPLDTALIAQSNPWGQWRDWWFQLFQLNLFFAIGCLGWLVVVVALVHTSRTADRRDRRFWSAFIGSVIFLGVAVHGARDTWGLTQICLQPLVLLALAFLAARWGQLSLTWRRIAVVGATVDGVFGLALHFAVQNHAIDRWLDPGHSALDWTRNYSAAALMNLAAKMEHQLLFFGDALTLPLWLVLLLVAAVLARGLLAVRRAAQPKP